MFYVKVTQFLKCFNQRIVIKLETKSDEQLKHFCVQEKRKVLEVEIHCCDESETRIGGEEITEKGSDKIRRSSARLPRYFGDHNFTVHSSLFE